jgi:hypothetical protein
MADADADEGIARVCRQIRWTELPPHLHRPINLRRRKICWRQRRSGCNCWPCRAGLPLETRMKQREASRHLTAWRGLEPFVGALAHQSFLLLRPLCQTTSSCSPSCLFRPRAPVQRFHSLSVCSTARSSVHSFIAFRLNRVPSIPLFSIRIFEIFTESPRILPTTHLRSAICNLPDHKPSTHQPHRVQFESSKCIPRLS